MRLGMRMRVLWGDGTVIKWTTARWERHGERHGSVGGVGRAVGDRCPNCGGDVRGSFDVIRKAGRRGVGESDVFTDSYCKDALRGWRVISNNIKARGLSEWTVDRD